MSRIISQNSLSFDFLANESSLYCNFNKIPIRNYSTDEIFVPLSTSGGSMDVGRFDGALRLNKNARLSYSGSLKTSSQMTFSFWLNSQNYGIVFDQSDPEIFYNIKIPVFSKAVWALSDATNSFIIDGSNSSFVVYEKCYDENKNSIIIELYHLSYIYTYESEKYDTDKNHHFFFTYDGVSGALKIRIDGVESGVSASTTSDKSVPGNINSMSVGSFVINDIAPGFSPSVTRSNALIDDLFICNINLDNEVLIKKIINTGIEGTFNSDGTIKKNKQSLFLPYREISTNYLKSISGNSSEIYLGSSEGDIYRGSSTSWLSRKNFTNQKEVDMLKVVSFDHEDSDASSFESDNKNGITINGYGIELE